MKLSEAGKIAGFTLVVLLQPVTNKAQPVTKITAGFSHSLFLRSDGSMWAMGDNYSGELGDGTYSITNRPEQVVASNVTAIAAGGDSYSLILKNDGSLWGTGANEYGQWDGGTDSTNRPERIISSNVTAIAAGYAHSLILKNGGSLWVVGHNLYGQLGDGMYSTNSPYGTNEWEQIVASNVTAIAAGHIHSLFLKSDGSLWAMGDNYFGQLGDGTYNSTNRPEQVVSSNVVAIAAGGYHSMFLKSDGSLWAMGANLSGELGDGTESEVTYPEQIVASNVTAIAAGFYHSLFLKRDGSLWVMGDNQFGQLGDGADIRFKWTVDFPEQIVAGGVTAIAGGEDYSLFAKSDGSLWAMGDNEYGQLGNGTYDNTNIPVEIVESTPGYNQISIQLLSGGDVSLSMLGIARANYALDHSFSLWQPNWTPLATNAAGADGWLVFSDTPNPTRNNFWRIRSVR